MTRSTKSQVRRKSLVDFARRSREIPCKLCELPLDAQRQLKMARPRRIPMHVTLAWLEQEYGVSVTDKEYMTHFRGNHSQRRRDT